LTSISGPTGGEHLGWLGDGDCFGEVALLRNVARTASITTITPCTFLTPNRAQF